MSVCVEVSTVARDIYHRGDAMVFSFRFDDLPADRGCASGQIILCDDGRAFLFYPGYTINILGTFEILALFEYTAPVWR